jgi:GR25 family glycosyltransferase involved in LPS biosynthesis
MIVDINKKNYHVCDNEFITNVHTEYVTLIIKDKLGYFERIISLLCELTLSSLHTFDFICYNQTHGGFVPLNCAQHFKNTYMLKTSELHETNIIKNIENHSILNTHVYNTDYSNLKSNNINNFNDLIIYSENINDIEQEIITNYDPIILTNYDDNFINLNKNKDKHYYKLANTNLQIYLPNKYIETFISHFHYYIDEKNKILNYDNLINLCIMVKNGGELFEQMLIHNMNIIDRWTILDTGSTDGTIETIHKLLVGKKKGNLYQEPFINFRDSRNRCLELAGKQCKYNIMLDDTYNVVGDLRSFLNEIRGDQFADSYSIYIKSNDIEYISNRITKSENNLRYIYTIHEVIQEKNNISVLIPKNRVLIDDKINIYMKNRSKDRNTYDLQCLYEMIKEYPNEPRHLYYLAQTYVNLNNLEKAAEYYYKRAFFYIDGHVQEKFDALFSFARISAFELKKPWEECETYFKLCTEWQPTRPEGDYLIGIYYYSINNEQTAFKYLKNAFNIGFPINQQYSLRPSISYIFTPYYLALLCYEFKDYELGYNACKLYLDNNNTDESFFQLMTDWYKIYSLLMAMPPKVKIPRVFDKPIFCIVADGGFTKWSGSNILTTGVGGSETWVIEMARYIKKLSNYEVIVFCNCENDEIFEGVKYIKLNRFLETIASIKIEYCIISRFSEYIPVSIHGYVENIYLISHDIKFSGNIIPIHPKLKKIFCLSEWHCKLFLESFPQFNDITKPLHYGIDFTHFFSDTFEKVPYSFIYSSFPNRGLIVVLKMWPRIIERYPQAKLNIFTDVNNEWANQFYKEELKEIRNILEEYKQIYKDSVINHGWVSKKILSDYWKQSAIWFYPCKFKETFCLTALEAALTKTLAITNGIAALEDTVGTRGITVPGENVLDLDWQDKAFIQICNALDNPDANLGLIIKNYQWAVSHSWENQAKKILTMIETTTALGTPNISMTITEKNQDIDNLNNFNNFKIYYINLEHRTDRNTHFLKECSKQGIPLEKIQRFNAINGLTHLFTETEKKLFENVDYLQMQTKHQIMGNQLSHFYIYLEMIKNNYETIIICQDDIIFKEHFIMHINNILNNLPLNAEIVHFGFNKYAARDVVLPWDFNSKTDDDLCFSKVNNYICKLKPVFQPLYNTNNSTGYILTKNGAKNYINHILKNGFKYATDCDINKYLIFNDIYYGSITALATTLPEFGSDVFANIYNSEIIQSDNKLTPNNNFLDYVNIYNWTNDLPKNTNAKITFVKMLSKFGSYSSCTILEIGTFVGTSVINMLQYLPNASATVVDNWLDNKEGNIDTLINTNTNNIENIFYKNVKNAGFMHRITAIKGDTTFVLIELLKQEKFFDFIYIDGSRIGFDCYIDSLVGWKLLNKNGIMAINLCLQDMPLTDDYQTIKGVEYFLDKVKEQSIVLEKGSRLFIQKINYE